MMFGMHSLLVVLLWTSTIVVSCGGHKLSSTSVSSLLELAGFAPSCVSRALAQCHEDSNPLEPQFILTASIQNFTQDIQQLSSSVQNLQSTTEALPLQVLMHTLQNLTRSLPHALTPKPETSRPRHCLDLQELGDSGRGVRRIFPFPCCPDWVLEVFCDQETDGGGWTLLQRRDDLPPYQDFYRTWIEYEKGFGDFNGEHWLGLENIHQLTSHSLQELRIDMADFDNATRWAKYGFFHVGDGDSKYTMHCGSYRPAGDAGDSLSRHSGQKFSTHDNDNDVYGNNCAASYKGAWWYDKCHSTNLNGKYLKGTTESYADGVTWASWRGQRYSLRRVEMKIRPSASPRS